MARVALTNKGGFWFEDSKAECYKEDKFHNGQNWISRATGEQWKHEAIYLTKGGKFILNRWSDFQGTTETYEEINETDAAAWFAKQSFEDEEIPDIFLKEVYILEIK